jgi:hypothetical protein
VDVSLADFHATPLEDGIELRWQWSGSDFFASMPIARRDTPDGPFETLHNLSVRKEGREFVVLDRSAEAGRTYWYRLAGITEGGERLEFQPISTTALSVTAFAPPIVEPNPSHGSVGIRFAVPAATHVRVSVVDVQGRHIATLADREYRMGRYELTWQGEGPDGRRASSGVYFIQLEAPGRKFVRRLVFVH